MVESFILFSLASSHSDVSSFDKLSSSVFHLNNTYFYIYVLNRTETLVYPDESNASSVYTYIEIMNVDVSPVKPKPIGCLCKQVITTYRECFRCLTEQMHCHFNQSSCPHRPRNRSCFTNTTCS